jgi:hypothetical protein
MDILAAVTTTNRKARESEKGRGWGEGGEMQYVSVYQY